MIRLAGLRARFVVLAVFVFGIFSFLLLGPYKPGYLPPLHKGEPQQHQASGAVLTGHAIAPKLGNATAKYV